MIFGIGTDIVAIPRLQRSLDRRGDDFARHILADAEWDEYVVIRDKARFLAKRFAVKEAFSKACGTGLRAPLALQRIWVEHDALGKPLLRVASEVSAWLDQHAAGWSGHVSISDEKEMVVAWVLIETRQEQLS